MNPQRQPNNLYDHDATSLFPRNTMGENLHAVNSQGFNPHSAHQPSAIALPRSLLLQTPTPNPAPPLLYPSRRIKCLEFVAPNSPITYPPRPSQSCTPRPRTPALRSPQPINIATTARSHTFSVSPTHASENLHLLYDPWSKTQLEPATATPSKAQRPNSGRRYPSQ